MPFLRTLVWSQIHTTLSRIWTWVIGSIFYDNNHYTKYTSKFSRECKVFQKFQCGLQMKIIAHSSIRSELSNCYEVHTISFQTFFVWPLLLIVHTWNSSPLRSNLLRLQCTCIVPITSGRPHGSPLVWVCQWPLSQPLSSPQLSHNNSLWA